MGAQLPLDFSFLFPEEKKRNKDELLRTMSEKYSPSALFCLLRCFSSLNKKNSLTLKQLFVFNAPKSTSASRQKSEAGPLRFYGTLLRSLGVGVFFFAWHVAIASFFSCLLPAFSGEA